MRYPYGRRPGFALSLREEASMGVEVGRVSTTARRRIAATAAVLLVVGLAPFVAALVAPQPALAVPGEDPVAPDAASARVAARASGHRVEVGKARRETSQTFVNSDGSFTLEEYAGPVRARRADGSWGAIDTTLRRNPDGSVSPTLDTVSLSFSGGGRAALASVGAQGTQLSLVWPGTLPAPVLHAETATYPDVLPGVDLLVRAEVGGFSELLVVKTREAAANPALTAVSFTTVTRGLTLKPGQGGSVSAVDAHGNAVFGSGTAMMWDSGSRGSDPVTRTSGERAAADPRGAAAGGRRAAMAVEVGPGRLTVKPDRALLTAPDATLPIYLDPSYYTATNPQWTMINGGTPTSPTGPTTAPRTRRLASRTPTHPRRTGRCSSSPPPAGSTSTSWAPCSVRISCTPGSARTRVPTCI